jgi:hypothetical protein
MTVPFQEQDRLPRLPGLDGPAEFRHGPGRLSVHLDDDVPRLQPRIGGRTAIVHRSCDR